jgi:hypothetical protein
MPIDPFREMAAIMRGRQGFDGTLLKFNKEGLWLAGKDGVQMNGVELIALVGESMLGFVLWQNKKPLDYHMGFIRDRYQPPRRELLGHLDRKRWRNTKDDPWQFTHTLPLFDAEESKAFFYSTTSKSGRDCLANLFDAWVSNKETHPKDADKLPLVTLAADSYQHPDYGRVNIPLLEINGWVERPADAKSIMPPVSSTPLLLLEGTGEHKLIEHVEAQKPAAQLSSDLDDQIPF